MANLKKHPLHREGTHQQQRLPRALQPDYIRLDERSERDYVQLWVDFAKHIRFYNELNFEENNWSAFFEKVEKYLNTHGEDSFSIENLAKYLENSAMHGLLWAFLKIFNVEKQALNDLTARHLDFYYNDILQLKPRPAQADTVHLIGELTKNVAPILLPQQTRLPAGKDGKIPLVYETTEDIILNHTEVTALKNVYTPSGLPYLKASPIANSADGQGAEIDRQPASWVSFADDRDGASQENRESGQLRAEVGFALASPIFFTKEGDSRVFNIYFNAVNMRPFLKKENDLNAVLTAQLTGKKGWISIQPQVTIHADSWVLRLELPDTTTEIGRFDKEIHAQKHHEAFRTDLPVVKIILKNSVNTSSVFNYGVLNGLILRGGITIDFRADGVRDLIVQNDGHLLDDSKTFMPFGALPMRGANLYIGNSFIFNKYLQWFSVKVDWNNLPKPMSTVYANYSNYAMDENKKILRPRLLSKRRWTLGYAHDISYSINHTQIENAQDAAGSTEAFATQTDGLIDEPHDYQTPVTELTPETTHGFLRLELMDDFGHQLYPVILTQKTISANPKDKETLPSPPYTPSFKSVAMSFYARVDVFSNKSESHFWHLHPFGYTEPPRDAAVPLLPTYTEGADLYIGLSAAKPPQMVSLLFQMDEGTGNPAFFTAKKVEWSYLSDAGWQLFTTANILKDTTQHLTASGIVRLALPRDATTDATLLPTQSHWLRAQVKTNAATADRPTSPLAYDRLISVLAQAFMAKRVTMEVPPKQPLVAETIKKTEIAFDGLKKLQQPFESFGGVGEEEKNAFNQRISERLRHKNRSWNIWDMERLVLQHFPTVFKAKSVSHSTRLNANAPRRVLLVVVPFSLGTTVQNRLQPRVSIAIREAIKAFLMSKTTPFVQLSVENPVYEVIKLSFKVRFVVADAYYKLLLNDEVRVFLAPWTATNKPDVVMFAGRLYKSSLINFIEERPYVEFVAGFLMEKYDTEGQLLATDAPMVEGSAENVVLTSDLQHIITMI